MYIDTNNQQFAFENMKFTPRELRAIELARKFDRKDLKEILDDYHFFVDTLIFIHESISEGRYLVKYWQKFSETLLHKFAFHSLTLHSILSGLTLKSTYYDSEMNGKKITDIASAKVVFRAQFEAFLMYHHIYVNPSNDDQKELNYNAWIYSSLLQRQEFPAETEFGKKRKEDDLVQLERMKSTISNLSSFKNLTDKQQKSLLTSGSGKLFKHWATLLKETGFTERNVFYTIYTLLSIYSHSEGLSVVQLDYHPEIAANTKSQAYLDVHHSLQLVCLMITSIAELFPTAKARFEDLPEDKKFDIQLYSIMAKAERDDVQ